ncbi:hypothetical protein [Halorientalis halophila]|uniref:hypothetical protein n=1 Tax=Halorientalis halophila TaxID=3108499 RepID=UPI00300B77F4
MCHHLHDYADWREAVREIEREAASDEEPEPEIGDHEIEEPDLEVPELGEYEIEQVELD